MRRHRPALASCVTTHQAVACEPHQAAARPARSTRPTARTRAPSGAQSGEPSGGREPGLAAHGLPAESARMRRRLVLTGASAAAGAPQRWPGLPAPPRGALDARPAREEQRRGVACMRSSGAAVARHRLGAGAPAAGPWEPGGGLRGPRAEAPVGAPQAGCRAAPQTERRLAAAI